MSRLALTTSTLHKFDIFLDIGSSSAQSHQTWGRCPLAPDVGLRLWGIKLACGTFGSNGTAIGWLVLLVKTCYCGPTNFEDEALGLNLDDPCPGWERSISLKLKEQGESSFPKSPKDRPLFGCRDPAPQPTYPFGHHTTSFYFPSPKSLPHQLYPNVAFSAWHGMCLSWL